MATKKTLLIVGLISLSVGFMALTMIMAVQMVREFSRWSNTKQVLGFQVLKGSVVYTTNNPELWAPDWNEPVAADAATFQAVGPQDNLYTRSYFYGRDAKNVYIAIGKRVNMLHDCDPATFEILTPSGVFARDATNVYYAGFKIVEAEASTFQVLGRVYSKDARRVYMGTFVVTGADPKSFEVLAEGTSGYEELEHSPPVGSYRDLKSNPWDHIETVGCWARDATHCFFADLIIQADRETFQVLVAHTAMDIKQTIYMTERTNRLER